MLRLGRGIALGRLGRGGVSVGAHCDRAHFWTTSPPLMEDYLAAVSVLWPGGSSADSYRRAVAQKCIRLGLQVDSSLQGTCKALSLGGTFDTERTLLESAVEETGYRFTTVSTAARLILPAAIFSVGHHHLLPCAIWLDLKALTLAAEQVSSPAARGRHVASRTLPKSSSVLRRGSRGGQCQPLLAALQHKLQRPSLY